MLHEPVLSAPWRDRDGNRGWVHRAVKSRHPLGYYNHPRIVQHARHGGTYLSASGASEMLDVAQRTIRFMDATGLKYSDAWVRVFGSFNNPKGFDHTGVWHIGNRHLVTTEPYESADSPVEWMSRKGWCWLKAPGWGMWNPPHTVLYIAFPPNPAIDMMTMRRLLNAAHPAGGRVRATQSMTPPPYRPPYRSPGA